MDKQDTAILRELAKVYAEQAAHPANEERRRRATDINELRPRRPLVHMDEIPWNEINVDGQLTLRCTEPYARDMELFFRRSLMRWKYFQADHILEPIFLVRKSYESTGYGLEIKETVRVTDTANNIISHNYHDLLPDEEALEQLHAPQMTLRPDLDERHMNDALDALHDVLPVRLAGALDYCYHAPWDLIPRLHGVNNVLMDLAAEPEFMHATIRKFTEIMAEEIDQWEKLGLLDGGCTDLHCTPGQTETLPGDALHGGPGKTEGLWLRHMAQLFGSVSPEMYNEFDVEYVKPLAKRFGLVYWGCCEPLDNVLPYLESIPNLRKVGVSPWSDVEKCAERIGGRYVLSRKPNPANVSLHTDEAVVREEILSTVRACEKYGCACDYTLKDTSSCGYDLGNLVRWNDTVRDALDGIYGPVPTADTKDLKF